MEGYVIWAKVIGEQTSMSVGLRTKIKLTGASSILLILYLIISADFTAAFTSAIPTTVHHHSMDRVIFLGITLTHSQTGIKSTLG